MSEWDGTKIAAETIIGMGMLGTAEKGLVDQLINDGSDEIARLREALEVSEEECQYLYEALKELLSGWKYIREMHGDLPGVGWDRAQQEADEALAKAEGKS